MKEKADFYLKQSEYSVVKLEPLFEHLALQKIAWIDEEQIMDESENNQNEEE